MSSVLLRILVFVSGMTVMAVEMTALRLLAPFFGTSLLVTTILIGSMMAFLSLGYWLGGRVADKRPDLPSLLKVTLAAAAVVVTLPFVSQPILQGAAAAMRPLITGESVSEPQVALATIIGGMLAVLLLLALPVTLMGMVSPWAVRLAVLRVDDAGKAAGQLYALSTFGSILGSFLPALALIPLMGVRRTFITVGGALLLVSALGLWRTKGAGALVALLALGLLPQGTIRPMEGLVYEDESLYHFIQVVVEPYGRCKEANHLYLNEGIGIHSVTCLDESVQTRGYWAYMAAAPLFREDPDSAQDALIIGLAGGTIARQLMDAFPNVKVDGVEIDGAVVEVGEQYFDNAHPGITPYVMDGRLFVQATDKKYDLIIVDAYRQPYIPFHLTTLEFWQALDARLNPGGVVAINVASVRENSSELSQMIYASMRQVWPSVHQVTATHSNDVLYATAQPTDKYLGADNLAQRPSNPVLDQLRRVFRDRTLGEVQGWETAQVLTDDEAPVEMAWDVMTLEFAG